MEILTEGRAIWIVAESGDVQEFSIPIHRKVLVILINQYQIIRDESVSISKNYRRSNPFAETKLVE